MPPLKRRCRVVFDTNVIVGFQLSRTGRGANAEVYKRWFLSRQLQLIVSKEIVAEYFDVLGRVRIEARRISNFHGELMHFKTVTWVTPGPRPKISRDVDDNVMIAAAIAGKAEFLITNDRDLLDIPFEIRRKFRFEIVTPAQFLAHAP